MQTNVLYGANFKNYVGTVTAKPIMVRPANGVSYDSFICDQYFNITLDGPAAPDSTAVAAINAIKAIPQRITVEDKALVKSARAAYDKIATIQQQALVTNYADLVSAEQRIATLESKDEDKTVEEEKTNNSGLIITIIICVLGAAIIAAAIFFIIKYKKQIADLAKKAAAKAKAKKAAPAAEAEATEKAPAPAENIDEVAAEETEADNNSAEKENGGEDEAE